MGYFPGEPRPSRRDPEHSGSSKTWEKWDTCRTFGKQKHILSTLMLLFECFIFKLYWLTSDFMFQLMVIHIFHQPGVLCVQALQSQAAELGGMTTWRKNVENWMSQRRVSRDPSVYGRHAIELHYIYIYIQFITILVAFSMKCLIAILVLLFHHPENGWLSLITLLGHNVLLLFGWDPIWFGRGSY